MHIHLWKYATCSQAQQKSSLGLHTKQHTHDFVQDLSWNCLVHHLNQGCGSGSWKQLSFYGSTLKKDAGSKLRSIWLFEEPKVEAFLIKHGAGMW